MFRIRTTYLYMAVALGLFCYIFFIDVKFKSTDAAARGAGLLYTFDPNQVNWLQITNASGTIVLEKNDNRWKITKPVQAFPEAGVMQQILTELEFLRSQREIAYSTLPGVKEETIKQWNLNPPVVEISFRTPQQSHVLKIGRNMALTETVYARASAGPEAPVVIVTSAIKSIVDKKLSELRSRAVFDFDSKEIDRAAVREFSSGSLVAKDVELSRSKAGDWNLQKPLVARAEKKSVEAWLRQVQDLRVIEFVSDESANLSTYGLSSPQAQIIIQKQAGPEELSLIIGNSPPDKPTEVYAKRLRSNSVYTLNKEAVTKIIPGLQECRDRRLVGVSGRDVDRVAVDQKGKVIAAEKVKGVWLLEGEENVHAAVGKVQDFINLMTALQATQFVKDAATDLKPYGLDKPMVKVTLRSVREKETGAVDILFGKGDGKQIYAMTSAEPFIYSVPTGTLDSLPKEALSWRELRVWTIEPAKVKELVITGNEGLVVSVQRDSEGILQSALAGQSIDRVKVQTVLQQVADVQGVQWLGKPIPAYGLDKPALRIAVSEESTHVLLVGAALPTGGRAAQVEGQPYVFELSLSDFNTLGHVQITGKLPASPAVPVERK